MSPLQHKIYTYIKNYLLENGYSPSFSEVAVGIGISPKSKGLISRYVKTLVNSGWLISDHKGRRNLSLPPTYLKLPVRGKIAAGSPIEPTAQPEILDFANIFDSEDCFILEVKGDSMKEEGILDKDKIICKKQSDAKEGDIVVALIDHNKAMMRSISYLANGNILLKSANPSFKSESYTAERITIKGIFVGLLRLPLKTEQQPKEKTAA